MKVTEFGKEIAVAALLSNVNSLRPLFRSLSIGQEIVQVCSEFGRIEVLTTEPTGIPQCLVNTKSAVAVFCSLSGDIEIERVGFELKWKSEDSKGVLSILEQESSPLTVEHDSFPWKADPLFSKAIKLAAIACSSSTVAVGLFGVVIECLDDDVIRLASTSGTALSSVKLPAKGFRDMLFASGFQDLRVVLRPPVPSILTNLLDYKSCCIDITKEGIFIFGEEKFIAQLPLSSPLSIELGSTVDKFSDSKQQVKLDAKAIKTFLVRAGELADRNIKLEVGLRVEAGRLILEQKSMSASSELFMLAEGLPSDCSYETTMLPTSMLALPLQSAQTVVFDYMSENVLVLRGVNPDFQFVLSGKSKSTKK